MKAMILDRTVSLDEVAKPLRLADLPIPVPAAGELLVQVSVCGVCHTELDEIEGRLTPSRLPIVLGHEVIGQVHDLGAAATRFSIGDRVGIGWIHHSNGQPDENLSPQFAATGCDVNGGYAQYITVPEDYAAKIPENLSDTEAAPLMCAGAIGYRALGLTSILDGQPLGLMGFGGSAHLVLQLAKHLYPRSPVFIFDRKESVQQFAMTLGADWAGGVDQLPPQNLKAIIDTTPAWRPVVESMKKLVPGGRLVINAIRKEEFDKDALLDLSYHEHLWMEREIKSVANLTHTDIAQFLPLAGKIPLRPEVTLFPLEQANEALHNLRQGGIQGANVLMID
jgi:propanol-preferring alcohol dehydrogenase